MGMFGTVGAIGGGIIGGIYGGGPGAVAGSSIGGSIGGQIDASQQAQEGAQRAERIANRQLRENRRQFDLTREDSAPWREAGGRALGKLESGIGDIQGYEFEFDPTIADQSYDFRFQEGQRAADRMFASRGMNFSGNRYTGLQQYGQEFASTEYAKEYDRQLKTSLANYGFQSDHLNRLAGLAGVGQTANQTLAGYGASIAGTNAQIAGNAGNAALTGGIAAAAGTTGSWNTIVNATSEWFRYRGSQTSPTSAQQ